MRLSDYLEAALVRGILYLLGKMPPEAASNLGGCVARAIGPHLPVSRVAHANLRACLPELDAAARHRIVRQVWDNLGRVMAEMPHTGGLRATASGPGFEVENEAVLLEAARAGGPALFVSGHIGNWEVLPPALATYGISMAAMYRAPSNPLLDAALQDIRRRNMILPAPTFRKGATGARLALAHLSRGGYLGLLVDQKLNDGIEARLFGLPAMTTPALAAFALRFRCPVIPGHVQRLGPARFRLVPQAPLVLPDTGDRKRDIATLTQTVNDRLEAMIRADPGSWLWLHRRWPKEVVKTK